MHATTDTHWTTLPDHLQVAISHAALRRAAVTIATQAELLAAEMDVGGLADRGGADALRLLAAFVRSGQADADGFPTHGPVGHA